MKRTTILTILLCVSVLKGYSQCKTCHDGGHFPDKNGQQVGKALPPDSSGGLANSFTLQNVCGLNWQQSSVLTTTRYPGSPGTGIPCTVPLTFDSCKNVDSVLVAFLYFNGSYFTPYAANPAGVSITNPAAQVYTYSADSIGTGPNKCWGETGTIAYRVNVTTCIKGGGNYIVNLSGTGIDAESVDGTTLLVVYIDKSATYSGSIALWDGLYTNSSGNPHAQTLSGFKVCNSTLKGQAFVIMADMQNNINPSNNQDLNGSVGTFPNSFYNFCTVTTTLNAGQTSTYDSVYTNDGGDCYSWVLSGLYWQNTNCQTCKPLVTGTLPLNITPPLDTICQGDSVQLTASGANTYTWGPATGLSCTNCPNPKASPNSTTTYSLTGFDGCVFGTDTVRIVVASNTPPVISPQNPQVCLPGSVQLTVTGGTNYVWKPAATLSCNTCSNPIASPTVTTTYTLLEGVGGCKDSTTVTVTVSKVPTVTATPKNPTICKGGSVKLTASGATNYNWSPAASLNCPSCTSPIASPTVTTVYTVVGSNGTCSDTATDTVYVAPAIVPVITPKSDSVCEGDSVVLTGSGGLTYHWSTGSTTSSVKVAPAKTTVYTLTVSNGLCSDTVSVKVKITPTINATSSIIDSIVCPQDSSFLSMKVTGAAATYKWSNGATTSSIRVSDLVTTTYTVTAYGACNNIEKTIKVTVVPLPQPVINGFNWRCKGKHDTLTISSSTNPTAYVWDNGKTTTTYVTGAINADSIVTVTAYNSLGCPVTLIDTILLRQPPVATANPPAIFCAGQPITLTASAQGTFPPFNFSWSTGQTGTSITIDPGPDSITTYTVTASNGCFATATTTAIPNIPILYACCNQILTNLADTTILVANGNSKTYQWEESPNKGTITCLNPPLCDSVRVIAPVTTSYTVIGTDTNGCQGEQVLMVDIDIPCFDVRIPNVFTPNNPGPLGLNSVFYIQTINMDAWSIQIYDRWGKEMFSSTNPAQYWDGTTKAGGNAADGVYYYIITATCENNSYKKDGFIQLIR